MSFRVEISPTALLEATSAFEYIHAEAPMAAERWYDSLLALMDALGEMPRRYPRAREFGLVKGDLRQAIHGPYRVVFTVEPGLVRVHTVRHVARDRLKRRDVRQLLRPSGTERGV